MTDYDLVEDYLDEFIDRIKSLRASARSEDLFQWTCTRKRSYIQGVRDEINEILDDMK